MAEFSKKHLDELKDMQANVEEWHNYFSKNIERYHEFMKFVFSTSLTSDDKSKLSLLQKPTVEFNVLEAYISRLRGEFANYEPELQVRAADNVPLSQLNESFLKTIEVVEGHIREIFFEASTHSFGNPVYNDILSGGFSVAKIYTGYLSEMSFEQEIVVERAFDPTMCGFDPMAREPHKGDGAYCFEVVPKTKEEFEAEFGKKVPDNIKFTRDVDGFSWSYKSQNQEVILVVDYYKKEYRRDKIARLSNGKTILHKHYDDLVQLWNDEGIIEQAPIVLETRYTNRHEIVRYRFCDGNLLDVERTNYKYLPMIFIDGNSVMLQDNSGSPVYQMTRPYVYHAKDIQKLKNFAGQTVASEIENMVQNKWKVALESIPKEYISGYTNPQQAQVLVYNGFLNNDPDVPLPPPQEVQRTATPPIVESIFRGSDQVTQAILGSYDGALGNVSGDMSGKAIMAGALQSDAASKPYLINYTSSLNRIAEIVVDLIPKYYVTPRSLPIKRPDGKREYIIINDEQTPDSLMLKYDPLDIQIKVETGVNSVVQKQIALEQIVRLMSVSETFAAFINSDGLETLLDNIDIRGAERLKVSALEFKRKMDEQQAAAAQQPDPMQEAIQAQLTAEMERLQTQYLIEMEKVLQRREQAEGELSVKAANLAIEKMKADTDYLKLLVQTQDDQADRAIEEERIQAENARDAVDMAVELAKENRDTSFVRDTAEDLLASEVQNRAQEPAE